MKFTVLMFNIRITFRTFKMAAVAESSWSQTHGRHSQVTGTSPKATEGLMYVMSVDTGEVQNRCRWIDVERESSSFILVT
ncbi:hypothetical protein TNCV_4215681 [Trichonephila clavipes]|nr:hypothetical protein TNCV_4215681 [Trichonephila clavipes]